MKRLIKNKFFKKITTVFLFCALGAFTSLGGWLIYAKYVFTSLGEGMVVAQDINIEGSAEIEGIVRGFAVPSDITWTNAAHNGDFGGYQEMNQWIQENGCPGYHVCDGTEVTRYQQHYGPLNINSSWYNSGRGFNREGTGNQHECYAWTSSSSGHTGAIFHGSYGAGYSMPSWSACNSTRRVLCCKY